MLPRHQLPSQRIIEEVKTGKKLPTVQRAESRKLKAVLDRFNNSVMISEDTNQ